MKINEILDEALTTIQKTRMAAIPNAEHAAELQTINKTLQALVARKANVRDPDEQDAIQAKIGTLLRQKTELESQPELTEDSSDQDDINEDEFDNLLNNMSDEEMYDYDQEDRHQGKSDKQLGVKLRHSATIDDTPVDMNESPKGSTYPLAVNDIVVSRNPNNGTYGMKMTVKRVEGDQIFCGGGKLQTMPYSRSQLQLIGKSPVEEGFGDIDQSDWDPEIVAQKLYDKYNGKPLTKKIINNEFKISFPKWFDRFMFKPDYDSILHFYKQSRRTPAEFRSHPPYVAQNEGLGDTIKRGTKAIAKTFSNPVGQANDELSGDSNKQFWSQEIGKAKRVSGPGEQHTLDKSKLGRGLKEDASSGASSSSSIATVASPLMKKPIKRSQAATSKYDNAMTDKTFGTSAIGKGIYEAGAPHSHKLSQQNLKAKQEYLAKGGTYKQEEVPNPNGKGTIWQTKKPAQEGLDNASVAVDPDQIAEDVKKAWHQVMPNSAISARKILGGWTFRFFLVNSKDECANGILENDPFYYSARLSGDGTFEETNSYMHVKPTKPNMVYGSVRFRKKTIKEPTFEKLVKRFSDVRNWIMSNADNLKYIKFDIRNK